MEKQLSKVKIDATSTCRFLYNRWLAISEFTKFDDNGNILYTKYYYPIQWRNIRNDLGGLFSLKGYLVPRLAYGFIMALLFILTHDRKSVFNMAFMGAVAFDAASSATQVTAGSTISWTHTCTGVNRVLTSAAVYDNRGTFSSATYNGVSMSLVGTDSNSGAGNTTVHLDSLTAPATGANTLTYTLTSNGWTRIAGAISVTGASGTITGFVSNLVVNGTSNSKAVTSATNDLVFDCIGTMQGSARIFTSGQTSRWSQDNNSSAQGRGSSAAGAASVTMSYTVDFACDNALLAANIVAGTQSSGNPAFLLNFM